MFRTATALKDGHHNELGRFAKNETVRGNYGQLRYLENHGYVVLNPIEKPRPATKRAARKTPAKAEISNNTEHGGAS